ncbi:HAD family phosphatase [bacterium]|nr:HAD family phosphatase [bacterium]
MIESTEISGMLQPVAVFDIDRTLLTGISAEELLFKYFKKRGVLKYSQIISSLNMMIRHMHHGWEKSVYYKSYYLKGMSSDTLVSAMPDIMETVILPKLSVQLMSFLPYLREAGYKIYLVSGTLGPIVDALVKCLGADGGIGSKLEIDNDIYTGKILEPHPYHHGKVIALNQLLGESPIDWDASFAFGDSWADIPLLSCFGCPVAINPGFFMRIRAKKRGWIILNDSANRNKAVVNNILLEKLHLFTQGIK